MGPRPLPRKQITEIQVYDVQVPISPSTSLDPSGLAARCGGIPILAPVTDTLRTMDMLVGQVMSNKEECLELRTTSLVLLLIICDHWESGRSEKIKLEHAVQRTESAILSISADLKTWTKLSSSDAMRNQRNVKISEHKERLRHCIDYLSFSGILQDHDPSTQTTEAMQASKSTTPRPPARKQASVVQLFEVPVVVSAGLDTERVAACCASVPGLAPVVETLKQIHTSAERVSWDKSRCRKLSSIATLLVFIICDHYDNVRADTREVQNAIGQTVRDMRALATDVKEWAEMSFPKSWYLRQAIEARINKHDANLARDAEALSVAATLQAHAKVATLQASLNTNNSADRRRAEDLLFHFRSAPPSQAADWTPAELACECVRQGSQPEYSGSRKDIWKGRWLDKRDVALIFYHGYRLGVRDDDMIRRFERQVRLWRKLDNPFVLRLYGWCKFEGETYLICPWLQNRDVVRYLDGDRNRHLKCLSLIYEIAQGLQYLHNQYIIHGSLKPSNILVEDDGRAVLSDFSLATLPTHDSKNSQTNHQINVFRYQALEVIFEQPISKASDVYSWAMTALDITTGRPPFYHWRTAEQLVQHVVVKNQIPTQSDYKSPALDEHPELWELFVRCWRREPQDRPTAGEIVEVLEKIPGLK